MNERWGDELALPRVRIRLRDVLAVMNGVAFLMLASGRLAREIRRWQEERKRWRQTTRRRRVPQQHGWQSTQRERTRSKDTMRKVTLYRPVGQKEYELIAESGFTAFPPRLPEQPLFYPVLNEEYATQIARDWNTRDAFSGYRGYVMTFAVRADFLSHYPVHQVGSSTHREYWIPAEDLPAFNRAIVGAIECMATFYGDVTPMET